VVEAERVVEVELAPEAPDPPREALLRGTIPPVDRVPPELPVLEK
jgi:hypothetical protein